MNGPQLSDLPDDSEQLDPHVSGLRQRALQSSELSAVTSFSRGFLLKFLRARDFDVELCLKLLLNYQRWRRESPELSGCLSPSSVLGLLSTSYHAVLPQRDHAGSRVLIYRIGQWNPKDWSAFQVFRVSLMTSEIISMETQTQRQGLKVIFDLQGWSLGHAMQINPSLARKISSVLSIHMHGADFHDSLSDFFSPAALPPEYGGEGPGIEEVCRDWTNHLLQSEGLLQQIAAHPTADIAISQENSLISEEAENEQYSEE
ncbi:alpha-tocopherol transfer protein isoform X2 [Paralichthys olivaceus]|uniref:alpha-tocopherol transfer protein isoform X2 n=1 Tax=Paralichthys olivaceus TaxID=8255 RepID=UPI00097DFB50|nr:PREDICTED: alpha-tocopherol transfer protein isoform X2 [Paralichthys olivaceus]